ncbi:MAG: hypothetical protein AAB331_00790 [Planctomycetota bacterium]
MVSSSWFRRHQKIVYSVMIFAMFVWGISYSAMELIPQKPIGKIQGRKITQNEFADMLGRWQRLFFPQEQQSVVSLVWKQLMLVEEAGRMGIVVTEQEAEEGFLRLGFQMFGEAANVDRNTLVQYLCNNFRLNQEQIVRTLREALLVEKLDSFMRSSVKMTSEEIWQRYSMENEQAKIKAIALKARDFVDSVNVTEDEIRAFYEKHKNEEDNRDSGKPGYKLPDRVKIECVMANLEDFAKLAVVSEDEIKKYYEENKDAQYKIAAPESAPAAKTAGADDKKPASDEKATPSYKPLAEVKEDIQTTLRRQKATEKVSEVIGKMDEEVYEALDKTERPSFKDLANKYKLVYEIPKSKVTGSEYLTEKDFLDVLPGAEHPAQAAFSREVYEPSTPIAFVAGKVVFQVIDKKPSEAAPLEEVRNVVVNDLKMEKGLLKAKEIAEKITGSTKAMTLDETINLLKTEGGGKQFPVSETDYFASPMKIFNKESRYIEALKEDCPNVAKKAFDLKAGQFGVAQEMSGEKACYIVNLLERKPADKTAFERDKDNVTKRYLAEKQEAIMSEWQVGIGRNAEIYTRFQ